ncbi:MAG: alpha-L-rhamnosidase C-terminal domain-containing protein [Planctomycetota bacterium]
MRSTLVTLAEPPFAEHRDEHWRATQWPASWVTGLAEAQASQRPVDVIYRLRVLLTESTRLRLHVSADERYDFRIDGQRIGRGPQRGDLDHWFFETYDVELPTGEHTFWLWVSSPGSEGGLAPTAQFSKRHGVLLAAEGPLGEQMSTGRGVWEATVVSGVEHVPSTIRNARLAGGTQRFDGRSMPWAEINGQGTDWQPVREVEPARTGDVPWGEVHRSRVVTMSRLPAMLDQPFSGGEVRYVGPSARPVDVAQHDAELAAHWQQMLDSAQAVTVPAQTTCSVLIDWNEYVCAYPSLTLRGGRDAEVRLDWAEALHVEPEEWSVRKAHRDAIGGLCFNGRGDTFIADGSEQTYEPLWWRAGRYVLLNVTTHGSPLEVAALEIRETRYPLKTLPLPKIDDALLSSALPILDRGLLMSMHEHYTDSPYYEQLQYVGDTRLESLCTYVRSADDRLPCRAIEHFGWSLRHNGLTQSRYPSHSPQVIPPFSLYWVAMLHDLATWRGQRDLIASLMPAARTVLETFIASLGDAGLPRSLPGWNFLDWVPAWKAGNPPGAHGGFNTAFAWQLAYTLRLQAELEDWFHEPELAERDRRHAQAIALGCDQHCFDTDKQLFADTPGGDSFSQHAQCFAVLAGLLPKDRVETLLRRAIKTPGLHQATIYFSHYLFEALAKTGLTEALHDQFTLWKGLPALGFKCPPESPEPTRSDCHAWGSHPLYHLVANVMGVRPAPGTFGFERVRIQPQLGPMRFASASIPHPSGTIDVNLNRDDEQLNASITLPQGLTGELVWQGRVKTLRPDTQELRV